MSFKFNTIEVFSMYVEAWDADPHRIGTLDPDRDFGLDPYETDANPKRCPKGKRIFYYLFTPMSILIPAHAVFPYPPPLLLFHNFHLLSTVFSFLFLPHFTFVIFNFFVFYPPAPNDIGRNIHISKA